MKKIIVTGASGLLGRAVLDAFRSSEEWEATGLAKTRIREDLTYLDLLDAEAVRKLLERERPDVLLHAAAERKPDLCEGQPELVKALNVTATTTLCEAARSVGAWTIFISTDYVFDGSKPPYQPDDPPHPINAYGESKLAGEQVALSTDSANAVLRIPILYGKVEKLEESAVTLIARSLLDPFPAKLDHWAVRRPTLVDDVAVACLGLANLGVTDHSCQGVWHFSGNEAMTKYDMAMAMAEALDMDGSHLTPNDQLPSGAPRPRDCSFDCSAFDALVPLDRSRFKDQIGAVLRPHLS